MARGLQSMKGIPVVSTQLQEERREERQEECQEERQEAQ